MKRILTPLFLGNVVLAISLSSAVAGAPKPTPTPKPHTVIGSISSDSITVNTARGNATFAIDKLTKFTYMGNSVPLADLKPGMRVSVTPKMDGKTAESINAGDIPKDPKAPKASPTPKKTP